MSPSTPDRTVLPEGQIATALQERGLRWALEDGALVKRSRHGDFAGALAYVNRVGALAEEANHHPDIEISWDAVTLRLVTHSSGGVTGADLVMAATLDRLDDPDRSGQPE